MTRQEKPTHFGIRRSDNLEKLRIRRALARRLEEKIRNYEKAAARLELRGEDDAAAALTQAAARLRLITSEDVSRGTSVQTLIVSRR
ncbi:MAG: hypothetical protein AAGD92_11795 [Pseudomonadota bacterium]